MDIRKLVDIHDPVAIEEQMDRERRFQNYLMRMGKRQMDKAMRKSCRQSQQRVKALNQAYVDTIFADDKRDSHYGGH